MKRFIGLILTLSILISCCITSNAISVTDNNNMSQVKIASREEIFGRASRAAAMPSSESDKLEYVETVFEYMGFDKKFIGLLSDDLIDEMLKAEEFGFSTNAINSMPQKASAQYESGSNKRTQRDMYLAILWFRCDDLYTVIGCSQWLVSPIQRDEDIISVDLGGGSLINNSPRAVVQYSSHGKELEYEYHYNSASYCGTGTACAFDICLPTENLDADEGSIVIAVSYQIISSNREYTISYQYFHNWLSVDTSVSVSGDGIGISVSPKWLLTEYNLQCGTIQTR